MKYGGKNSEKAVSRDKNIKNLKPFKKGQSGNPKGRPKKLPEITALLDKVLGETVGGISEAEKIMRRLIIRAKAGDVRAAEVLLDRAYGKPKQSIDMKTKVAFEEGEILF